MLLRAGLRSCNRLPSFELGPSPYYFELSGKNWLDKDCSGLNGAELQFFKRNRMISDYVLLAVDNCNDL
jgi:hypothetical protein